MNDLISRQDAVIQLSHNKIGDDDCDVIIQRDIETIKQLPPAEPKMGKWIYQNGMIKCDQCLRAIRRIDHDGLLNYCPNCGADMRGEQK